MSVFNGEKYLSEAIASILGQSFKDFEFLIINDASTDNTEKIIRSHRDSRIKIIANKKNLGLTKSLNKGLEISKGEYIARQDADDISFPERLEKQAAFMDKNKNVGLLGSSWLTVDEVGKKIQSCQAYSGQQAVHFMCHGSVMIRKSCLEKVGYYREIFKYAQDYDLWLRLRENFGVASLKKRLYKLRIHQSSISVTKKGQQDLCVALALKLEEERKKTGKESMDYQILNLSGIKRREILSHTYSIWSKAAFDIGIYKRSYKYSLDALGCYLLNCQAWTMLIKNIMKIHSR